MTFRSERGNNLQEYCRIGPVKKQITTRENKKETKHSGAFHVYLVFRSQAEGKTYTLGSSTNSKAFASISRRKMARLPLKENVYGTSFFSRDAMRGSRLFTDIAACLSLQRYRKHSDRTNEKTFSQQCPSFTYCTENAAWIFLCHIRYKLDFFNNSLLRLTINSLDKYVALTVLRDRVCQSSDPQMEAPLDEPASYRHARTSHQKEALGFAKHHRQSFPAHPCKSALQRQYFPQACQHVAARRIVLSLLTYLSLETLNSTKFLVLHTAQLKEP